MPAYFVSLCATSFHCRHPAKSFLIPPYPIYCRLVVGFILRGFRFHCLKRTPFRQNINEPTNHGGSLKPYQRRIEHSLRSLL
nr:MAG TPA: hypothetical protein [Caudoviricetes sp.]